MTTSRWLAMYLGLFGTYRKDETFDIQFSRDGKVELRSDLARGPLPRGAMNIGFLLLADHSEAVTASSTSTAAAGNVLRLPELPHEWSFHIGLGIDVAWHETNDPHELIVTIQDPDGIDSARPHRPASRPAARPAMPAGQEQRL